MQIEKLTDWIEEVKAADSAMHATYAELKECKTLEAVAATTLRLSAARTRYRNLVGDPDDKV